MNSFAGRLQYLVSEHNSANAFAKKVGIVPSLLRKYLAGGTPGLDKVVQIARATDTSIEWLALGEGQRDLAGAIGQSSGTQQEREAGRVLHIVDRNELEGGALVLLPRLNVQLSAGPGAIPTHENVRDFVALEVSYLKASGINPGAARLVEVEGRSMMPTLVDGEWVIVDLSATNLINDLIYAVLYREALLVKRVRRDGSAIVLVSDNTDEGYGNERIDGSDLADLRIIGRVKRHIRSL